jgi:3-hydroxypropanoate dehydrogenase
METPMTDAALARTEVNAHALDTIFREARTRNAWEPRTVPEALLRQVYDVAKMGATSANCSPARFMFITSAEGKEKLRPLLLGSNVAKTMSAPVCVIIATDTKFYDKIPQLFPHNPGARDWFTAPEAAFDTGFRNGTLQGAYLMLAARALGLDCGPMSGFDRKGVDAAFFAGNPDTSTWESNWLCNLGYGTDQDLFPRLPRLAFEEACTVV